MGSNTGGSADVRKTREDNRQTNIKTQRPCLLILFVWVLEVIHKMHTNNLSTNQSYENPLNCVPEFEEGNSKDRCVNLTMSATENDEHKSIIKKVPLNSKTSEHGSVQLWALRNG